MNLSSVLNNSGAATSRDSGKTPLNSFADWGSLLGIQGPLRESPPEVLANLSATLGGPALAELWRLESETDPRLFYEGLTAMALRHERRLPDFSARIYAFVRDSADGEASRRAALELERLLGRAPWSRTLETQIPHFAREAANPASLLAMVAGGAVFRATRLAALGRLASAPGPLRGLLGAKTSASLIGFAAEGSAFPLVRRLAEEGMGHRQDWDRRVLFREWASSYLLLGGLKSTGFATRAALRKVPSPQLAAAASTPTGAFLAFSQTALPQLGMLAGILVASRAETALGLREETNPSRLLAESLATLFHFNVAGRLTRVAMGESFHRWERGMDLRFESRTLGLRQPGLAPAASAPMGAPRAIFLFNEDVKPAHSRPSPNGWDAEAAFILQTIERYGRNAEEPLAREARVLAENFREWEEIRKTAKALRGPGATIASPQGGAKRIIYFDGLPGTGKTTQIDLLRAAIGAEYISLGKFAAARDVSQGARKRHQLRTLTLHDCDRDFLEALRRAQTPYVIIEKMPRTPVEALALHDLAAQEGWELHAIHLTFPGDPVAESARRQIERGPREGEPWADSYPYWRALRALARDSSGRRTLADLGVPVHRIDAGMGRDQVTSAIRSALGLEHASLPWELETLRILDDVGRDMGIEAWVASGGFYRPWFNNQFGPAQRPTDIDVAVERQADVDPLFLRLRQQHPRRRWSVLSPITYLKAEYGIEVASLREAKGLTSFLHKGGMVRWLGGIEVFLAPGTEASLRTGVLGLNPRLLEQLTPEQREGLVKKSADKVQRTLREYPGLRVDSVLDAALRTHFGIRHSPRPLSRDWVALKSRVLQEEIPARGQAHARRALSEVELAVATRILSFHRDSQARPEAPELPPRAELPQPLEDLRNARDKQKGGLSLSESERRLLATTQIPPPEGYSGWLHYMTFETPDAVFRDWLLNQAHHHKPYGGRDPLLEELLTFRLFQTGKKPLDPGVQSAMHQGWTLDKHLVAAALELETDWLLEDAPCEVSPKQAKALRASMRMAMLFHDTGKLFNAYEPRRHAKIGARLWQRHAPPWFPGEFVAPTQWMVETHDLLGAFGRSLMEKRGYEIGDYDIHPNLPTSYSGGVDSQAVRRQFLDSPIRPFELAARLNLHVWSADVGAVAALRWLKPVAQMETDLVMTRADYDRREGKSPPQALVDQRRGDRRRRPGDDRK